MLYEIQGNETSGMEWTAYLEVAADDEKVKIRQAPASARTSGLEVGVDGIKLSMALPESEAFISMWCCDLHGLQ
jgi:hypothetical protein